MSEFEGRSVVVTGAASGIGRAAAQRYADEGANVLAVDKRMEWLAWTEEVSGIVPYVGSVAEQDVNEAMVQAAVSAWGRLDIAFLNAGVPGFGSILDPNLETWERNLNVNLIGVVHGIRAVVRQMVAAESGGSIVVTASISGMLADAGMWAYNATKAGVINLVRSVAGEVGKHSIRVNAVCPGSTRTGMVERYLKEKPEIEQALQSQVPLGRWGEAIEVAEAAIFLSSDKASYITGAVLPVDGGVTALTRQFRADE